MRRKIIKQGTATLTLSLPAKWAKQFKLKAGDEVDVDEEKQNLVIAAKKLPEKKDITIELSQENKHDIKLVLTHAYRKGFDTITLKGLTPELMRTVNTVTKDLLLGFEITERDGKQCKITNISEPTEEKYEVLQRRCFLIIKETQTTIKQDLAKGKYEHLKEIQDLKTEQDKFTLFCLRILTKQNNATEWEMLKNLMYLEHEYYYLYEYLVENPIKSARINELMQGLDQYLQLLYDANYKQDIHLIHIIHKQKEDYQFGKCLKYLEQSKGKEAVALSYIREIFRRIQLATSPIIVKLLEINL